VVKARPGAMRGPGVPAPLHGLSSPTPSKKRPTRPTTLAKPLPGTPGAVPLVSAGAAAALTLEQAKLAKVGNSDPSSSHALCGSLRAETRDSLPSKLQSTAWTRTAGPMCAWGPGRSSERVTVHQGLDNMTLAGSGVGTVITSQVGALSVGGPFQAATMTVYGNFFRGAHFILENSLFTVTDPCPAVATNANRTSWQSVGFISWVDTVALRFGHHLFQNCLVSGLTDIIWGFWACRVCRLHHLGAPLPLPHHLYTGFIPFRDRQSLGRDRVRRCTTRCAVLGTARCAWGGPTGHSSTWCILIATWA